MTQDQKTNSLRAVAQAAASTIPTLTEDRRRLILSGIIELDIPEAEDASRYLALLEAADAAQNEFFASLGLSPQISQKGAA